MRLALMLVIGAIVCGCARSENSDQSLADANARLYRMYYDAGGENAELIQRKFAGHLRIADVESRFGTVAEMNRDAAGNYVSGWHFQDGLVWAATVGPGRDAVNLVTVDYDGTTNSAFDLDQDGVADIVDIGLPDKRRFTFVTEELGREIFESWLRGRNPLCEDRTIAGLHMPLFGCENTGSGGSSGSGTAPDADADSWDPFADICDDYQGAGRIGGVRPPVYTHGWGALGPPRDGQYRVSFGQERDDDGNLVRTVGTRIYRDEGGEHLVTYRYITHYDDDGNVTREVHERLDSEGHGTRRIIDHGADGTTKEREETFEQDPESYHEQTTGPIEEDVGGSGSSNEHPGRPDGTGSMEEWCAAHQPYESGAERAADSDPAAFEVACEDLVRSGNNSDCVIVEWASPEDFDGVLEDPPSAETNCGPFEQPGPDGTCGAATGIQRLKGMTAEIMSADLGRIEICNPLVCNPAM